ncbi:MAG: hypothetical protein Tsb0033_16080 [Winogradskyella sp.]
MNLEAIKNILPSSFVIDYYSDDEKQVYLTQKYHDNDIAKYIFDIDVENEDIKIKEYQDKYVSKDFFESVGNLQWNYYLIFLRNTIDAQIKRDIEKDESYARKFVFTLEEFKEYINYEKTVSTVEENVVDKWKTELEKCDLQEVFSNEPYNQAVPRYLNNETKKIEELSPLDIEPDKAQDFVLDEVTQIQLNHNYRNYPEKRLFDFGKVNLICGSNGVGKTSLMEAIELVVTGNNARNANDLPENGAIEAKYATNSNNVLDTFSNNIPKFKARNYYWYNTSYNKKKSNTLHQSFNRYNFYNSDSAYHLSNNTNSNQFISYLSAIALGTEFGAIRERMFGFVKRLSNDLAGFEKNIEREQSLISNANKQKEKLKQISNPEEIFRKFLDDAEKVKWINPLPAKIEDKTRRFEEDYDTARSILNSIVHSKAGKESDVLSKLSGLKELQKNLQGEEKEIMELNAKIKEKSQQIEAIEKSSKLLNDAISYLENPQSFRIETIEKDVKSLTESVTAIERFFVELNKLNLSDFIYSSGTLADFRKTEEESLSTKESELKRSREQLQILKEALDKVKSIIIDIKYYGKEYIEAKADLDACPLCETPHTKAELLAKVQTEYIDQENTKRIEVFTKNIASLESDISKTKEKLSILKRYEDVLTRYFPIELSEKSIPELIALTKKEELNLDKYKKDLEELKVLDIDLKLRGYELDSFLKLKQDILSTYDKLTFKIGNKEQFDNQKATEQENVKNLREILNTLKGQLEKTNFKIAEMLQGKYNPEGYTEDLKFEIEEYQTYRDYFLELKKFIDIDKDDFIIEIRHSLEALYKTFENFKEQKIKFEELNLANKIIQESNEKIARINPKRERAESGLMILNKLTNEDGEDKVLDDFFRKNETEISEIFTNIHAPKEFSKLSFASGEILLYRKSTDERVPITHISTGQRSALALSIFLALNKKLTKGPNLIIFDDPVTFTDDLNILSFLDYLRSMVINESRQLVFATASKKIATLFQKKFDFLKSDFKKFELSRSNL